jgi:hypothetical protein
MPKKRRWRNNAGGATFNLPMRRSYEREAVEQRGKHPDPREIKPTDRPTTKEVMELSSDAQRQQRLAELKLSEMRNDPDRAQRAQSLNERAEEYMNAHDTDYTTALSEVVRLSESGAAEPSVAEVERYAKEHNITDFGQAVREIAREKGLTQSPVDNSISASPSTGMTPADEEAALRARIKERGYDLD